MPVNMAHVASPRLASILGGLAAVLLVACGSVPAGRSRSPAAEGEVLVGLHRPPRGLDRVGRVLQYHPALGMALVALAPGLSPGDAERALLNHPDVRYVEANYLVRAASTPNDTRWSSQSYARLVQADLAYDLWEPARPVDIALVDTGVDYNHSDLSGVMRRDAAGAIVGWDFANGDANPMDDNGHGTLCAGIAAAHTNNANGIAGIVGWNPSVAGSDQWVRLVPVKALGSTGTGTAANVAAGIQWAADHGALVILTGFAAAAFSQALADAVAYAQGRGCLVVAAAGNSGSSADHYPAALPGVLALAGTDANDVLVSSSNWGAWVDAAGPGSGVYSTNRNNSYAYLTGTSAAAAHAAGAAAAILSARPDATAQEAADFIAGTTDPYTPYQGRTLADGAGRVNVYKALSAAMAGDPVPVGVGVSPATVTGGAQAVGTVLLGAPAPEGGVDVALTSSDPSAAQTPSSVLVTEGATTANFAIATSTVSLDAAVTITAAAGGVEKSGMLNVLAPRVSYVDVVELAVTGGSSATLNIVLGSAAPAGGMAVELTSDAPAVAQLPETAVVPAGATGVSVTVSTTPVAANTSVILSAVTFGTPATDSFTVKAPIPYSFLLNPRSVVGGTDSTGTLTLTGPAPEGGVTATAESGNPAVASTPATFLIPEGATSGAVQVDTVEVTTTQTVQITVVANGYSRYDTLTVTAAPSEADPRLAALGLSPTSIYGSLNAVGTVTLDAAAPAGGTTVSLSSSVPGVAAVPATATVQGGAKKGSFAITTTSVTASTPVTITASLGSVSLNRTLTVTPLLKAIAFNPTSVVGGTNVQGTVTLAAKAPAGGVDVALVSGNPVVLSVPALVHVAGGSTSASVAATTSPVALDTGVTVTATLDGASVSKSIQVKQYLKSFTATPITLTGGASVQLTVTLNAPAPVGGLSVELLSTQPLVIPVPAAIAVAEGAISGTVTVDSAPVASQVKARLTARLGVRALYKTLTINP